RRRARRSGRAYGDGVAGHRGSRPAGTVHNALAPGKAAGGTERSADRGRPATAAVAAAASPAVLAWAALGRAVAAATGDSSRGRSGPLVLDTSSRGPLLMPQATPSAVGLPALPVCRTSGGAARQQGRNRPDERDRCAEAGGQRAGGDDSDDTGTAGT